MMPDPKIRCPATGFTRSCRDIVTADDCVCPKFVSVKGMDPQTGAIVDRWGCVDAFLPLLLIENTQQSRQTGAAVESFRNEVVKANEAALRERQEALQSLAHMNAQPLRQVSG